MPIGNRIKFLNSALKSHNKDAITDMLHKALIQYRFCSAKDITKIQENGYQLLNVLQSYFSSISVHRYLELTNKMYCFRIKF